MAMPEIGRTWTAPSETRKRESTSDYLTLDLVLTETDESDMIPRSSTASRAGIPLDLTPRILLSRRPRAWRKVTMHDNPARSVSIWAASTNG